MQIETGPNPCFVWIRDAALQIEAIGAGNPRLEAEYLMAASLGIPRIGLWLRDHPPSLDEISRFEALLARRLRREPLQYILGTADFAGLTLEVGPGVFIPRSETETLVDLVAKRIEEERDRWPQPRVIDVGTGCGAILLGLLHRLPQATGIGIERQLTALAWAKRNVAALGLSGRARLQCCDLLSSIAAKTAEVVVSNPPYIRLDEADSLAAEIRKHEPAEALFAGPDGLDLIRRIVPQAATVLVPGGLLGMEIGITQDVPTRELLSHSEWKQVRIFPDLTGRPRIVLATRSEV